MGVLVRLINTAVAASWLILAVTVLRLIWRRAPRWIFCALWALAAVRLLCPLFPQSALSLIPSARTVPDTVSSGAVLTGPLTLDVVTNPLFPKAAAVPVSLPADRAPDLLAVGTAVWLAGVALIALWAFLGWLRLRRTVAASLRVKGDIYICDGIGSAFILGLFRPRIYLPSAMDREHMPYVIAHEQAHLRRRDHWWKALGFALVTVYWFQPLVWPGYGLFCRDMEMACDESAVRRMSPRERRTYSEVLLAWSVPGVSLAVSPLTFGEVGAKARVRRVLHYQRPAAAALLAGAAVCIVMALCFLTDPREGASLPASSDEPKERIVHRVDAAEVAARNAGRAEEADGAESLPDLIFYEGELYAEVSVNALGIIELYSDQPVGTLSLTADQNAAPGRDLETNDPALAGAEVMRFECSRGPGLCVRTQGRLEHYIPWDPDQRTRIAATLSSEENFLAALMEEMAGNGYQAMHPGDYEDQAYAQPLVSLARTPAEFQDSGYVFVRRDPGGTDWTATAQLLYSYERQAAIEIVQYAGDGGYQPDSFTYSDQDEMGVPLADYTWFGWEALYMGMAGSTEVSLSLRSVDNWGEQTCRDILTPAA